MKGELRRDDCSERRQAHLDGAPPLNLPQLPQRDNSNPITEPPSRLTSLVADSGLLSALDAQGVDFETIESLLPTLQNLGALEVAAKNQQLLINLLAPPLVEGAPLLIPVLAGAVKTGPVAFFGAAAALAAIEASLVTSHAQIPFVGLSAGFYLGLLLVPLTGVIGGAGVALASAKK